MISPHSLHAPRPIAVSSEDADSIEMCRRQFAAATREMGAFVKAVHMLFGSVEAAQASEFWVELAEREEMPLVDGYPNWRHITVAAASQLAQRRFLAPKLEQI
jgi:hypothetical protein